jgi:hypothetical protein
MYYRLKYSRVGFVRPQNNTVYSMLKHKKARKNPERNKLLKNGRRKYNLDGLSTVVYNLIDIIKYPLFTHILIDVGNPSDD